MKILSLLLTLAILLTSVMAGAVQLPTLSTPVLDQPGWLSQQEKIEIENWLYSYRQNGKAQIQVAIVQDLQGLTVEQYAIELAEQWKLGNQKRDDGVLFLMSANDRKMRIEVGQGLEGALTDVQSKRILDDRVRPLFKSGDYAAGIAAGVSEIVRAVDPEYAQNNTPPVAPAPSSGRQNQGESYLFWIILFLIIISNLFGRGRRRGGVLPFLGGFVTGSTIGRGGWGSGGGGWSGGGGGFSGGGASSDW